MIAGVHGRVLHISVAAEELLGRIDNADPLAVAWFETVLLSPGDEIECYAPFKAGSKGGEAVERKLLVHKRRIRGAGGDEVILAWLSRPAFSRALSVVDPLTALPGRAIFIDRVQQAMLGAGRARKSVAVLLVGVDRLGVVNEALGYAAGDQVLVALGKRLRSCLRGSDAVTRLEGDLFGLVLALSSLNDSILVAEKIFQEAIRRTF